MEHGKFIRFFDRHKREESSTGNESYSVSPAPQTFDDGKGLKKPETQASEISNALSPDALASMSPNKVAQFTKLPLIVRQNPVANAWVALETNDKFKTQVDTEAKQLSVCQYTESARETLISTNANIGPVASSSTAPQVLFEVAQTDNGFQTVTKKKRRDDRLHGDAGWDDPANLDNLIPKARVAPKPQFIQIPLTYKTAVDRLRKYEAASVYVARTWKSWPELITSDEAMDQTQDWQEIDPDSNQVILYPNILKGSFKNKEQYLRIQYELFREEAVRPIREAVAVLRQFPDGDERGNFGIYENVRVTGLTLSFQGIGVEVAFSTHRAGKKIQWELSTRLMPSSIVALSSDNFQSECIIAVVASHNLDKLNKSPPKTDLFFAEPRTLELDPLKRYVMVEERTGFFEAQRHVMVALQRMSTEKFPLQGLIVRCDLNDKEAIGPPQYVLQNPFFDMSRIYGVGYEKTNILEPIFFDTKKSMLDKSQSDALHHIFSQRLAIVQGPPGTGKTFVSVVAIQLLLQRWKEGDPPIIIACQTNHAVDQLLKHVAKFEERFARLGGRSRDGEIIKSHTLYELRRKSVKKSMGASGTGLAARKLNILATAIRKDLRDISVEEDASEDSIDHKTLFEHQLISEKQCQSFEDGDTEFASNSETDRKNPLTEWLGRDGHQVTQIGLDHWTEVEEETKLEPEEIKEREADALTDENEQLQGQYMPVNQHIEGRGPTMGETQAINILKEQNVWKIPQRLRGSLYNYFVGEVKRNLREKLCTRAKEYHSAVTKFRYARWERDAEILLRQKIIGMTTTGLNKYRPIVQALSPRVFIIEEAAEALEAPVVSGACIDTLEHLILVGDHMQLRPSCIVHDLKGDPFHLDLSLFERMVDNAHGFKMLRTQRRMIPEIRKLLYPIYGGEIHDHKSVLKKNRKIPGVEFNTFMWVHRSLEHKDDTMSTANLAEAEMLVGFCAYLLVNGVEAKRITILTFYQAQRKLINQLLRKQAKEYSLRTTPISLFGIKIATVDSYQGEENDIVLLSLVRSNEKGMLGFSGVANRICVALSRARIGLYIFCNIQMFAANSLEWNQVYSIISEIPGHVDYELPLKCSRHGNTTKIRNGREWMLTNNGGCAQACAFELPCGHICAERCHPGDHDDYPCHRQCSKIIENCGHRCQLGCYEKCICLTCNPPVVLHEADLREKVDALGSAVVASAMAAKYGINKIVIPHSEIPMRGPPPGLENVLAPVPSSMLGQPLLSVNSQTQVNQNQEPREPIQSLPVPSDRHDITTYLRNDSYKAKLSTIFGTNVQADPAALKSNPEKQPVTSWNDGWTMADEHYTAPFLTGSFERSVALDTSKRNVSHSHPPYRQKIWNGRNQDFETVDGFQDMDKDNTGFEQQGPSFVNGWLKSNLQNMPEWGDDLDEQWANRPSIQGKGVSASVRREEDGWSLIDY